MRSTRLSSKSRRTRIIISSGGRIALAAAWPSLDATPQVAHSREFGLRGKALQLLLRQAVVDVSASVGEAEDATMQRLVE